MRAREGEGEGESAHVTVSSVNFSRLSLAIVFDVFAVQNTLQLVPSKNVALISNDIRKR